MRIICATDFSEPGRAAIDTAVALARKLADDLKILHVIDPMALVGADAASALAVQASLKDVAEREVDKAVEAARARGVAAEGVILQGGVVETILEASRGPDVRLVVMGTHGRKRLASLFMGKVAERVIAGAPCPVLATHGTPPGAGLDGERRLSVLVGADGSRGGDAALAWVRSLRERVPCDVTFFHPYWPQEQARRFGVPETAGGGQPNPELLKLLERELRRWVGALPGEGEVCFSLGAFDGRVAGMLAAEAERVKPDVVVIGAAAPGGRDQGAIMSAGAVLRAVHLPVICVPEALRPAPEGRIPAFRTVLVGTDLSDFSNQGVPAAYALLRGSGGHVVLCHVYQRSPDEALGAEGLTTLPRLTPSAQYGTEELLRRLVPPEAEALGITSEVAVVQSPSVCEGLLQEAERIEADAVVIASHGRAGMGRAILGSAAEALVRASRHPVLVLHPPRR
jgi:nucleotide-binding universal stress UspA family protein